MPPLIKTAEKRFYNLEIIDVNFLRSIKLNLGKNQTIIDAIWHVSNSDPNVVVCLTSDNHLRFFRIGTSIGTSQFKEFNLTGDSNLPKDLDQKCRLIIDGLIKKVICYLYVLFNF